MQPKRDELEGIARAAFDLVVGVEEWLGSAGTREAATDALRRLEIKLIAAGFEPPIGKNLDFRRSILDDLERMGLRYDCRDEELHFFVADEARCYASGPRLADFCQLFGAGCKQGSPATVRGLDLGDPGVLRRVNLDQAGAPETFAGPRDALRNSRSRASGSRRGVRPEA